eukprot:TRINITY_DN1325_c0_g1_i6.p1 TRINITY_DN1325_c0_g1~~TRINITY_DN1325_c0_g1_i6.p1  ORF type:complete len:220 (+),score=48.06 TRINITY_DN1325_c0_g1_i6:295-954(+)
MPSMLKQLLLSFISPRSPHMPPISERFFANSGAFVCAQFGQVSLVVCPFSHKSVSITSTPLPRLNLTGTIVPVDCTTAEGEKAFEVLRRRFLAVHPGAEAVVRDFQFHKLLVENAVFKTASGVVQPVGIFELRGNYSHFCSRFVVLLFLMQQQNAETPAAATVDPLVLGSGPLINFINEHHPDALAAYAVLIAAVFWSFSGAGAQPQFSTRPTLWESTS